MYGNIIGDLSGSIYEYDQFKNTHPITVNHLIKDESFISDDSILTVAVADAYLNKLDYGETYKEYVKKYSNIAKKGDNYFKSPFSPGFIKWTKGTYQGISAGNGAMMRIAPIAYMSKSIDEVTEETIKATIPSHNSEEAINNTLLVAKIIFYAKEGMTKEDIFELLKLDPVYKQFKKFNMTCSDTIDNCLYAIKVTDNFCDAVKTVISYGGDTDTNGCIVGGIAEALYGIDNSLIKKAEEKIPKEFNKTLQKVYKI